MPGLVDFVSTPANGATKTLKTVFPYLYTGQVKQKHEKLHHDIMQWKWAALLSQSSIRRVGMLQEKQFYRCYIGKHALNVQSRKKKEG